MSKATCTSQGAPCSDGMLSPAGAASLQSAGPPSQAVSLVCGVLLGSVGLAGVTGGGALGLSPSEAGAELDHPAWGCGGA